MTNILPTEKAKIECLKLMSELDADKSSVTETMYGICICLDEFGNEKILKAFSGQLNGRWVVDGWVEPVLNEDEFDNTIVDTDKEIKLITKQMESLDKNSKEYDLLRIKRKSISNQSMKDIFKLYSIHCIDGTVVSIEDVFGSTKVLTGTGDCCAIKLLNHAFKNHLKPVSLAEFYYGQKNNRCHKEFYSPCDERCKPIIKKMLGLDILYYDGEIVVVNKPEGLLSSPGKGEDKFDCVVTRVQRFYNLDFNLAVHRLDMDTSGILVLALTKEAHRNLSIQFMDRKVSKKYIAVLDGLVKDDSGYIELPFRLDIDNRPYQIIDYENGKMGISTWKKLSEQDGKTRVEWSPITGRTHQLRLQSKFGLNAPIVGDRLYGVNKNGERMLLHASYISFAHPVSGEKMEFTLEPDF